MSSFNQVSLEFDSEIHKIALSKCHSDPIMAIIVNQKIKFYNVTGLEIHVDVIKRKSPPNVLEWHPDQKILAIGWSTGTVSLFNHETGISFT